jgi:hypothetical protein
MMQLCELSLVTSTAAVAAVLRCKKAHHVKVAHNRAHNTCMHHIKTRAVQHQQPVSESLLVSVANSALHDAHNMMHTPPQDCSFNTIFCDFQRSLPVDGQVTARESAPQQAISLHLQSETSARSSCSSQLGLSALCSRSFTAFPSTLSFVQRLLQLQTETGPLPHLSSRARGSHSAPRLCRFHLLGTGSPVDCDPIRYRPTQLGPACLPWLGTPGSSGLGWPVKTLLNKRTACTCMIRLQRAPAPAPAWIFSAPLRAIPSGLPRFCSTLSFSAAPPAPDQDRPTSSSFKPGKGTHSAPGRVAFTSWGQGLPWSVTPFVTGPHYRMSGGLREASRALIWGWCFLLRLATRCHNTRFTDPIA